MVGLIGFVIELVALPIEGFAISKNWSWFVEHQFHLPAISTPQGAGISVLVSIMTHQFSVDYMSEDEEVTLTRSVFYFLLPLCALLTGWIIKAVWL